MSNQTPSRSGQVNLTGDPWALYLKVFGGEVYEAFDRASVFRPRHMVRVIPNGKSAQFPLTGLATVQYHTPGAEIDGQRIRHAERVINVEDMVIAPVFVADVDDLMNHYDVTGIYAGEMGQALAKFYDQNVARTFINAARASAAITGQPDGAHIEDADLATDAQKLWQAIFNAGVIMDQRDVPNQDRYSFLPPVQVALLVRSEKPINTDLNPGVNNGGIARGQVFEVAGIPIVKSNNVPNADDRANDLMPTIRKKDYSPTVGFVGHRSAAGTVQLQDITMSSSYDPRRLGTLMLGKYLAGHDVLRTDGAIELRTGAPSA